MDMNLPKEELARYVEEKIEAEEFDDFHNVQGEEHERMILRSVIGGLLDDRTFQTLCIKAFAPATDDDVKVLSIKNDKMIVEATVWIEGSLGLTRPDARRLIDHKRFFWDDKKDCLIFRGEVTEDVKAILERPEAVMSNGYTTKKE